MSTRWLAALCALWLSGCGSAPDLWIDFETQEVRLEASVHACKQVADCSVGEGTIAALFENGGKATSVGFDVPDDLTSVVVVLRVAQPPPAADVFYSFTVEPARDDRLTVLVSTTAAPQITTPCGSCSTPVRR